MLDNYSYNYALRLCVTLKSVVNIISGNLLLSKKFNYGTLTKRNMVVGHFVSIVYGHVMQATDAIPHS
jgi:hypothetical protein